MSLTVNGEPVDTAVLRAEEKAIRPRLHEAMKGENLAVIEARVKEWGRENVVERVLLRQAAVASDNGNPPPESPEKAVEQLLAKVTANVARPRNKDITDFYRKHREKFITDEMIHASHILKRVDETQNEEAARVAINEVLEQIALGASFEKFAEDLGFFTRNQMVPEFERVVFALAPGAVSEVFRTPFGFHVAKVYERRPPGIPKLEEIRAQIEETIFQQKRQKVIEQYLDRLRAKADIKDV